MDTVDRTIRSRIMSSVPQRDSAPELKLRKELHHRGFRYRIHVGTLPGKPDFVFPRYKTAVFVHGCFWHRHEDCRLTTTPQTNREFWSEKFRANVARDSRNNQRLGELGWRVVTVWQCEVEASVSDAADKVIAEMQSST